MQDDPFVRRQKKPVLELQLTAMIDIFSMIVIFLILGSVFGASEMIVPPGMLLPFSASKESAESAPRLVVAQDHVEFSGASEMIPFHFFENPDSDVARAALTTLESKIHQELANKKDPGKNQPDVVLNVLADQNLGYEKLFKVIQYFRQKGFAKLLFVALGDGGKRP